MLNFLTNIVLVIPQLPLLLVLAAFIGEASPLVIAIIIGADVLGLGRRASPGRRRCRFASASSSRLPS